MFHTLSVALTSLPWCNSRSAISANPETAAHINAPRPRWSRRFKSAFPISKCTTAMWPFMAAQWSAVEPVTAALASTLSSPCNSSNRTTCSWPAKLARWSTVRPGSALVSLTRLFTTVGRSERDITETSFASSVRTNPTWPEKAAMWSAERPVWKTSRKTRHFFD